MVKAALDDGGEPFEHAEDAQHNHHDGSEEHPSGSGTRVRSLVRHGRFLSLGTGT
jgi:hypothetical protein